MKPLTAFAIFMTAITLGLVGLLYAFDQDEQLRLAAVTAQELEHVERQCRYVWPLRGEHYRACVEGDS